MHNPAQRQKTSSAHKGLYAVMVLCSLLAGLQSATQYAAHQFQYQSALGASFLKGYWPWSIIGWQNHWGMLYPTLFSKAMSIGLVVSVCGLLLVFVIKTLHSSRMKQYRDLHGSARWAEKKDIERAGLFQSQGVYIGAWQDDKGVLHYLRHNGPEHILTYAPTRSGKGVGLVLPTLLSWEQSAVITDLKGELWAMTSGWRQQYAKNKVIRFEPATSKGSARWNPLDEIRIGTDYEVGDVQNLATMIVDPHGKGLNTHWDKTSQSLLVGFILHALYKLINEGTPATLPNIDAMLVDSRLNIQELFTEMKQYPHCEGKPHPVIAASAQDMVDRPEEEAGSVLSTLKTYLSLFRDPVVGHNVSHSDFKIRDLMHHDDPVSLYIITQPNDKARLQPLVRLMLNMVVRLLADKMEFERVAVPPVKKQVWNFRFKKPAAPNMQVRAKRHYKHRLLGMIDEFPSLGKLDILQESLAFVAGYGIKFYLICQDINQLKSREQGYGPDESITSNCHIQNAYPPNRLETAEHLSKLTGQTTVIKEQVTISGKRTGLMLGQVSKTLHESQRYLLTPDECQRMPGPIKNTAGEITQAGDMIIYAAGFPAIYGKQPLYFEDPVFVARAAVAAPECSDILLKKLQHEIVL